MGKKLKNMATIEIEKDKKELEKVLAENQKLSSIDQKVVRTKTVWFKDEKGRDFLAQIKGTFWRAVETKDFIYFVDWSQEDENYSVRMYRKSDLSLASSNYFGYNDLMEVIDNKTYTWLSKSAKTMVKHIQKENE